VLRLRSARAFAALSLALTILFSYGLHYVIATLFGWRRTEARLERVHEKNA